MHIERGVTCGVVAAVSLLALEPALVQMSDTQKIEQLQRQTELLEKQLRALKEEIAQTRKKTEKVEPAQAGQAKYVAQELSSILGDGWDRAAALAVVQVAGALS